MRKDKRINGFKAKTATRRQRTCRVSRVCFAGDRLIPTDGKRELWIALGTTDYRAACVAARREAVRVDTLFEAAKKAHDAGEAITFDPGRVSEAELRQIAIRELWEGERAAARAQSVPVEPSQADRVENLEEAVADLRANEEIASATLFTRTAQVIPPAPQD